MIDNTTDRDPLLHMLGMLSERDDYIPNMEAAGQRQLVRSETLPTEGDWDRATEVGIIRGELVSRDPLFTNVTLPDGWRRESTDHAMHSRILDDRGVPRIGMFYKAAFYDRRAEFHFISVGYEVATHIIYGEGTVELPDYWARLDADEKSEATDRITRDVAEAKEWIADYGDVGGRKAEQIARGKEALRLIEAPRTSVDQHHR